MFKSLIRNRLNEFLRRRGSEIVYSHERYEWQRNPVTRPSYNPVELPADAQEYLKPTNPLLVDLQRRYSSFNSEVTTPLRWGEGHLRTDDIAWFRGDNAYVWQLRGSNLNVLGYALALYYAKSIDTLGLLDKLEEDRAFGVFVFQIADKIVSRDLIDSVIELYFLEKHLGIASRQDFTVLDIGAGYGRLAYRAVTALPQLKHYFCTDAVPYSTFISDYYLRYRHVDRKAKVIPIDEIEKHLESHSIDLAINIHSFPECRISAIDWWVSRLQEYGVKHLFIVPNALDSGGEKLKTNDGHNFADIFPNHGYKLIVREPKYRDPIAQQYAICPTWHYLFELA